MSAYLEGLAYGIIESSLIPMRGNGLNMTPNPLTDIAPDMTQTDEWLDRLRCMGRKENTLATHRGNVRRCLKCLGSSGRATDARSISSEEILFLWENLSVKEEVRWAYLRSLSAMVEFHTGSNVLRETSILHNREVRDRVFITKEEFGAAYAIADPFQKVVLCLGAYMGLRRNEMVSIRDGDLQGDTLTVHGKGHGRDGLVVSVRVPEPVRRAIEEYRSSPMKQGESVDDYLLQNRGYRGELHRASPSMISCTISDLGKAVGARMTTHSLRRFYATTLYYETECDLQTVRNLMRHADVATTLRCYVDAYDAKEDEASRRLTEFIDGIVVDQRR